MKIISFNLGLNLDIYKPVLILAHAWHIENATSNQIANKI